MSAPVQFTDREVSDLLVGYHEAGHAHAALAAGLEVTGLEIVRSWWSRRIVQGWTIFAGTSEYDEERIDDWIIMMFAGYAAEKLWLERYPGHGRVNPVNSEGDTEMARGLMHQFGRRNEGQLRARATSLVTARWDLIDPLAHELIKRRRITVAQARRTR